MSIINEALKKAGQPIVGEKKSYEEQKNLSHEPKSKFRVELLRKKAPVNWGPVVIMGLLALITAPIIAPLFNSPYKSSAQKLPPGGIAAEASFGPVSKQFAIEESPISTTAVPNFSLNGLVYSNTDSYCLINGKVMRVGDQVNGATLSQVTPNQAVLDYRGEKIVLPASAA